MDEMGLLTADGSLDQLLADHFKGQGVSLCGLKGER